MVTAQGKRFRREQLKHTVSSGAFNAVASCHLTANLDRVRENPQFGVLVLREGRWSQRYRSSTKRRRAGSPETVWICNDDAAVYGTSVRKSEELQGVVLVRNIYSQRLDASDRCRIEKVIICIAGGCVFTDFDAIPV